jgi:hypothetical protein
MIATNILYFSFFSAVWVWPIDEIRTPEQQKKIDDLLSRTDHEYQWISAYRDIDPAILVPYFVEYFELVSNTVNNHLNRVDFINPETIREDPILNAALEGFPRHIFLMRYSNLGLLKHLKELYSERQPDQIPVLAVINDRYIHRHVTVKYHVEKSTVTRTGFMPYMIDLALLCSMNEAMVDLIFIDKWLVLERYQDMIYQVHQTMARLMRIASLGPYTAHSAKLQAEVDRRQQSIRRGYAVERVQETIQKVVHLIIPAILMYGNHSEDSPRVLSRLIRDNRAVLEFLILDRATIQAISHNCERLLTCLEPVVIEIAAQFRGNNPHPWVPKLVGMVKWLKLVGTGYRDE